jgi:hypothetical protein
VERIHVLKILKPQYGLIFKSFINICVVRGFAELHVHAYIYETGQ